MIDEKSQLAPEDDADSDADDDCSTDEDQLDGNDEGDLSVGDESVLVEKADRSMSEFHRWKQDGRLNVQPEWQRNYVWTNKRASKLIESFLVDIPVPVIYLAKTTDGTYEVIDGVQRLTSVFHFLENKFALSGLELKRDLVRKRFRDLPKPLQNKLLDATLRTLELSAGTSKDLLFIIFERLNTGGVALNDMEIRNCIYRGRLNDLIKELATYPPFVEAVNQRKLSTRMNDRSLVLRFLAFHERTHLKATNGLKPFFNEFFEYYKDADDHKITEYDRKFKEAARAALTVFGNTAFRLRKVDGKGAGDWASRVNASIFQVVSVSFAEYDLAHITENADAILEEYLDLISTDDKWVDCVTTATGEYNRVKYAFETWKRRLAEAIGDVAPRDGRRVFSCSLKQEMYNSSRTCARCGQEIRSLNDAALDHEQHYWRGGRTIPSNARLMHRTCNLKRPNDE